MPWQQQGVQQQQQQQQRMPLQANRWDQGLLGMLAARWEPEFGADWIWF